MANGNFWSSILSEPKRQHTFVVDIGTGQGGEDAVIPRFAVAAAKKPSAQISEAEANWLNHTFYYPGKVKWDPIDFTFYDAVNPNVAKALMKMLKDSGYYFPNKWIGTDETGKNAERTVSKKEAATAIGQVKITQLNHDGDPIETWTLKNAWFSKLNFGTLDYKSHEILTIEMTLRFDWAEPEVF